MTEPPEKSCMERVNPRQQNAGLPSDSRAQIRNAEEDWAGISDLATRKKLQNRLNQRLYIGQRRANPNRKIGKSSAREILPSSQAAENSLVRASQATLTIATSGQIVQNLLNTLDESIRCRDNKPSIHKSSFEEIEEAIFEFEPRARGDLGTGSPRADLYLTLIQFNVWRALISNMADLKFGREWYESEEAISPHFEDKQGHRDRETREFSLVPQHLRPTDLQRRIRHHPWIDLLPFPQLRDNLLLAEGMYDETDLCNDLLEFIGVSHENTGLIVWCNPWDTSGWEVSESFLVKWGWVLVGCDDLLTSTQMWRARRGEPPLGPSI